MSPTTERNPLEVVEEALAGLRSYTQHDDDCPAWEDPYDECLCGEEDAVAVSTAALALVRKMRADAVVGSHGALVEALREIAEHEHPGNTLSGYHDLQAIARRALASLTDEAPTDG
jgi:hypothetical protein